MRRQSSSHRDYRDLLNTNKFQNTDKVLSVQAPQK